MNVPQTVHAHYARMDGIARTYKGVISLAGGPGMKVDRAILRTMPQAAERNATQSGGRAVNTKCGVGAYSAQDDPEEFDSDDEVLADTKHQNEWKMYSNLHP